jgi:predicted Zn-dependent protease
MTLSESDVRSIFDTALNGSKADQVELSLASYDETNRDIVCGRMSVVRFSNSYIRDNTEVRPYYPLMIRVAFGRQEGMAVTNQLDPDGVGAAVRQAEQIAKSARPTDDHLPPLGKQQYPDIPAYDSKTASAGPAERLAKVASAIAELQKNRLNGSGYFHVADRLEAYATSAGNWFYRPSTRSGYSVTVRSDSTMGRPSSRIGSGSAATGDLWRMDDVDVDGLTARAAAKARQSVDPQPFPMGRYTVVLEPSAAASFVQLLAGVLRPGTVQPGQKVASEKLTVRSKPDHPQIMASPYGEDGLPSREVLWIERGVVKAVARSRLEAAKNGGEATGTPTNLVADGGTQSLDDLIAAVKHGMLITQLNAQLRDRSAGIVNGMTRNGLFLIDNGKIARPLKNCWYTVRWQDVVGSIEDLSSASKTASGSVMPAVRVPNFHFYRLSDAV